MVDREALKEFKKKLAAYGVPVPMCTFSQVGNSVEVFVRLNPRFSKLIIKHLKTPHKPIVIRKSVRMTIKKSELTDDRKVRLFAKRLKQMLAGGTV